MSILYKYQRGSKLTTEQMDSTFLANKEIPFVDRIVQNKHLPFSGFPKDHESSGKSGSHYMGSFGNYVIPLIQQSSDSLKYYNERDGVNRAIENNNFIYFDDPKQAQQFAEEYKNTKSWKNFIKENK